MKKELKLEKGQLYRVRTNIYRRRQFIGTFIEENVAGYFFDTGYGDLFIEKANWIKIKVEKVERR